MARHVAVEGGYSNICTHRQMWRHIIWAQIKNSRKQVSGTPTSYHLITTTPLHLQSLNPLLCTPLPSTTTTPTPSYTSSFIIYIFKCPSPKVSVHGKCAAHERRWTAGHHAIAMCGSPRTSIRGVPGRLLTAAKGHGLACTTATVYSSRVRARACEQLQ